MKNDVTHAIQLKCINDWTKSRFEVIVTSYGLNKNLDDKIKNIEGQVVTYNSKNIYWLNRKLDLERTMNGLGKPSRKKSDPKNRKNSKNQSEIAASEQKPLARIFVQTPFSHSTLNLEQKKFHAAKPLAFSLHFLFRRDQNHYSNLTSKIMKKCDQILKQRQRPNTIQILSIVKTKQDKSWRIIQNFHWLSLRGY